MTIGGTLKLEDGSGGGNGVGFKAPDTEITSDIIWTLPDTEGSADQVMVTSGATNP